MWEKAYFILLILVFVNSNASAQVYMNQKTQHRFAQSYLGINLQVQPGSGSFIWNGQSHQFPVVTAPRINIGGMHFWGKVDFNMNFPVARFTDPQILPQTEIYFNSGGDLSMRYYPWRLEYGKIQPYFGYSANEMTLGFDDEQLGFRYDFFITSSALGGLSFAQKDWKFHAEFMWMLNNERDFYSNRFDEHTFKLPNGYLSFGFVKFFEGTLKNEEDLVSGNMQRWEQQLRKENKLNSFSLSFAPSGAYALLAPSYPGDELRQSLPRHKATMVWEYAAGYLFHDAGIHLGLTFRDYTFDTESFEFEHLMRRGSLSIEMLKFVGDYQGFVPFIGPTISFERWAVGEFLENEQVGDVMRTRMISPGIIFGWDILASPLETWVLRTNLRYYPFQKIKDANGTNIRIDQFEFNFIQLVLYPNRMIHIPKLKGRL